MTMILVKCLFHVDITSCLFFILSLFVVSGQLLNCVLWSLCRGLIMHFTESALLLMGYWFWVLHILKTSGFSFGSLLRGIVFLADYTVLPTFRWSLLCPSSRRGDYPGTYNVWGCIQKSTDWPPGARPANDTALCYWVQLYHYFVSQPSAFCRHNPLSSHSMSVYCCERIYIVITSVRKVLDTPSYIIFLLSNVHWSNFFPYSHFSFAQSDFWMFPAMKDLVPWTEYEYE